MFTDAGVLGSLSAACTKQAGQDVYLLARGDHLVDLRQNGIRLQNMLTGQQENVLVNLVERLAPQDTYDLVIVVMGKHQSGCAAGSSYQHNHSQCAVNR